VRVKGVKTGKLQVAGTTFIRSSLCLKASLTRSMDRTFLRRISRELPSLSPIKPDISTSWVEDSPALIL
jgi:hypothetical protein